MQCQITLSINDDNIDFFDFEFDTMSQGHIFNQFMIQLLVTTNGTYMVVKFRTGKTFCTFFVKFDKGYCFLKVFSTADKM